METNIDIASENEEIIRANAIIRAKQNKGPKLTPKGRCHSPVCDDDLEHPEALFCPGGQCARDYDHIMKNSGNKMRNLKVV